MNTIENEPNPAYGAGLTQFLFDKADLEVLSQSYNATLSAQQPPRDFVEVAADAIAQNLKTAPERYLQYGPYWWAVKTVLANNGLTFGANADSDSLLSDIYCVKKEDGTIDEALTLIAADNFKNFYHGNYFAGSSTFYLGDDSTNQYTLLDEDMESLSV